MCTLFYIYKLTNLTCVKTERGGGGYLNKQMHAQAIRSFFELEAAALSGLIIAPEKPAPHTEIER